MRVLDNIRKVAKSQNRLDWYQRMAAADDKMRKAVKAYHDKFPDSMQSDGSKRKAARSHFLTLGITSNE